MAKVLVTGGNGFIGRRLVNALCLRGDQVRIVSRRAQSCFSKNVEVIQGDLTANDFSFDGLLEGCTLVYHCAGEIQNQALMRSLHVGATERLLTASLREADKSGNAIHWVQLSSVGAYGPPQGNSSAERLVTEATPVHPVGEYEVTKTLSDELVVQAARNGLLSYSILRPSIVYGVDMPNQSLFQLIRMIDRGLFFFIGREGAIANYIHVDNVVNALVLCGMFSTSVKDETYIVSDYRTLEEFVGIIATALGRTTPHIRLPESLVRAAAATGAIIPRFPLSSSRVDALTSRTVYSSDKIQSELGYVNKISMGEGISELAHYWKK
nr:NAD-dependent epimerase/dehydratase family protein [uncultured Pseudomonas sp.]